MIFMIMMMVTMIAIEIKRVDVYDDDDDDGVLFCIISSWLLLSPSDPLIFFFIFSGIFWCDTYPDIRIPILLSCVYS